MLILIASADRVPDPPVIKPYQDKAATLQISGQYQPASDLQRSFVHMYLEAATGPSWLRWANPFETKQPIPFAIRLNQAADSSPPARVI